MHPGERLGADPLLLTIDTVWRELAAHHEAFDVLVDNRDVLDALVSARSESTRVGDLVIGERVGVNVDTRHAVCEPA